MDKKLNELLVKFLEYKQLSKDENICPDDSETYLLETLESAGFSFTR